MDKLAKQARRDNNPASAKVYEQQANLQWNKHHVHIMLRCLFHCRLACSLYTVPTVPGKGKGVSADRMWAGYMRPAHMRPALTLFPSPISYQDHCWQSGICLHGAVIQHGQVLLTVLIHCPMQADWGLPEMPAVVLVADWYHSTPRAAPSTAPSPAPRTVPGAGPSAAPGAVTSTAPSQHPEQPQGQDPAQPQVCLSADCPYNRRLNSIIENSHCGCPSLLLSILSKMDCILCRTLFCSPWQTACQ